MVVGDKGGIQGWFRKLDSTVEKIYIGLAPKIWNKMRSSMNQHGASAGQCRREIEKCSRHIVGWDFAELGDKNLSTLMKIPQSQASPIKSNCELAKGERDRERVWVQGENKHETFSRTFQKYKN